MTTPSPLLSCQARGRGLNGYLLLDLETTPDGRLFKIGALRGEATFLRQGRFDCRQALRELEAFARGSTYVLGHNLLDHDLPVLQGLAPDLALLRQPVIDTLYLSPLAFPENPYHRLVKDYKLVRDSLNDPLQDARLAGQVFVEQVQALNARGQVDPGHLGLLRFCFEDALLGRGDFSSRGLNDVFAALGGELPKAIGPAIRQDLTGRVCGNALEGAIGPLLENARQRPALAYLLAWLKVAGGNSVLPPWVRRRFLPISPALHQLRDIACGDAHCHWCRQIHDPVAQLDRFFGYPAYRSTPTAPNGGSLQQAIVSYGMSDRPLLAILPTGGGKSLCYQIPALVRHLRRGTLTVVISPLQALMKDQVDGLINRTGTTQTAALYGLLTPPERGEVLERTRLGDIAILYISPEQLRNRSLRQVLAQREIGAWVFDEAHCLSKWGHDFRPDYLYAARFIREFAREYEQAIPPIACYTATAKRDVIEEIRDYFRKELAQELALFQGGVERDNLRFEVQAVTRTEKYARIHALLTERLKDQPGSAVVYAATRRTTEEITEFLKGQGWQAEAFHAGLAAPDKRRIQEAFITGEIAVICATNAFGMGIDKDDVRLVIHADAPGSLENYLQEAGRAGRDREAAECILLYAREDIETQFKLGALSELSRRDIAEILRALRKARRNDKDQTVTLTSGELLRDESLQLSFETDDRSVDTRVKTAVAWLERAGFIERNENHTRVFQGKPLVRSLDEARPRMAALNLSAQQRNRWEAILQALVNVDSDQGLSVDELAQLPALKPREGEPPIPILRILDDMARQGLLGMGLQLSAYVRAKGKGNALRVLERISALEQALLDQLRELAPEADDGQWWPLELRPLNQRLLDSGLESSIELLRNLIKSLAQDGKGLAGKRGSLENCYVGRDSYRVRLQRDWKALCLTAERRRAIAQRVLQAILDRIPEEAASSEVLVEFGMEDLRQTLKTDMVLSSQIRDPLAALERALLFLHEHKAIILQKGLAVFRQAMTIRVLPEARGRRYSQGDYQPLAVHYQERVFQVHVMEEYARLALEKIRQALELVSAYFTLDRKELLRRFFPGRQAELTRATSPESFRAIVDALGNPAQIAVVAAPANRNMLILAGPGAGKTRVVVHRCAYLLRVLREPAPSILVLCYNRNAALSLRRRLTALAGEDARGVTVQTYHSLALRLTGHALADRATKSELDFTEVIKEAVELLRGERELPGLETDELRDRLLAGYRHILVDEYQDIDEDQYQLVSAIAGRTLDDPDRKLSILAVGDDDQNIYAFRGANVGFIRRFREDYQAEIHYLVENYRSTAHIIATANRLIAHNQDRMKIDQPIHIDKARRDRPKGGNWQQEDPLGKGQVQLLQVADASAQAVTVVEELKRLRSLRPALSWSSCAILARQRAELHPLRAACEYAGIPVTWGLDRQALPAPHRIREVAEVLNGLRDRGLELIHPSVLLKDLEARAGNPWCAMLITLLQDLAEDTSEALPALRIREELYTTLAEQRREQRLGEGVFLGTAHAAKGLEFDQVFVLGGGWGTAGRGELEAERRLFYVAMTRAREGLWLVQRSDQHHPHLKSLDDDLLLPREFAEAGPFPEGILSRRFEVLGLDAVYLAFAGRRPAHHLIHAALQALQPGDPLTLMAEGQDLLLKNTQGIPVASLSRSGRKTWLPRLADIESVRVMAMIRRFRKDSDPEYRDSLQVEEWEVPLVEVVYHDWRTQVKTVNNASSNHTPRSLVS